MRFTWLIEPRELGGFSWFLPAIAVFLALAAPAAIIYLVKTDRRAQQMVSVFNSLDGIILVRNSQLSISSLLIIEPASCNLFTILSTSE